MRRVILGFAIASASISLAFGQNTPSFTIKDLGTLGGTYSQPTGINKLGQVTGWSYNVGGVQRAYFWDGSKLLDIGDLGAGHALGYGINDLGHIGGVSGSLCTQYCPDEIFLWDGNGMKAVAAAGGFGVGGINDRDQITWATGGSPSHGYLWTPGSRSSDDGAIQDIGALESGTIPQGINNLGQVTGFSGVFTPGAFSYQNHAFFWNGSAMQDLGTLGRLSSYGTSINDLGQIAGYVSGSLSGGFAGAAHAFFWDGSIMHDIHALGQFTYGHGINKLGQVVGQVIISTTPDVEHAFFWDGSAMWDLNKQISDKTGWTVLTSAQAINDQGQITGYGTTTAGQVHAFVLTLVPADGAINVSTNLDSATFTISGAASYNGTGQSFTQNNAPAGTYTITYDDIAGYATPVNEIKALTAGGSITFTGSYTFLPQSRIVVSPQRVTFLPTLVNTTSAMVPLTISNFGTGTLTVTSVTAQCLDCAAGIKTPFILVSYPNSVPPGEQGSLFLTFSPTTPGTYNGAVTITSNDSTSPTLISLQGVVVLPPPPTIMSVSPMVGIRGGNVTPFTVNGSGFQSTSRISFGGNASDFTINYISMSGTQIVATVVIAAHAAVGSRDIVVTNPYGNATVLTSAFAVRMPTFEEAVQDGIEQPHISPGGISTTFRPHFGFTLKQAAHLGGYDHFNWLQVVTRDTAITFYKVAVGLEDCTPGYVGDVWFASNCHNIPVVPYVDPPLGGWVYQGASPLSPVQDNLDWYLDEVYQPGPPFYKADPNSGHCTDLEVEENADSQNQCSTEASDTLIFEDEPTCQVIPVLGDCTVNFLTILVGVKPDGTGDVLNVSGNSGTAFVWHVVGATVGTGQRRQNTQGDPGTVPYFDGFKFPGITAFTQPVLELFATDDVRVSDGVSVVKPVTIDIRPGDNPNSVNPRSNGEIPVAIISSLSFTAPSEIEPRSLTFGHAGTEGSLAFCHPEDVNGDRLLDLVCHFHTAPSGFQGNDTKAILMGKTRSGLLLFGTDSIRIVSGTDK